MNTSSIAMLAALILTAGGLSAAPLTVLDTEDPPILEDATPDADEAPADFHIIGVSGHGRGCPGAGSFSYELSPSPVIRFSEMKLHHDPGGSTLQHIHCTVAVTFHVPQGWQVSIVHGTARGHVRLATGATAQLLSDYSFAGVPFTLTPRSALTGPRDEDFVFSEPGGRLSGVSSPCGQDTILNIGNRIVLNTSGASSDAASTSLDEVSFHLEWHKCR